jgi:hypothetical protein
VAPAAGIASYVSLLGLSYMAGPYLGLAELAALIMSYYFLPWIVLTLVLLPMVRRFANKWQKDFAISFLFAVFSACIFILIFDMPNLSWVQRGFTNTDLAYVRIILWFVGLWLIWYQLFLQIKSYVWSK